MRHITDGTNHIYLALGATDFRKQLAGLAALTALKFGLDPHCGTCVFLFCNKWRNALRALRWDGNGFLMVTKYLSIDMKFQCPKDAGDIRTITPRQMEWLLDGLSVEQKKAHPTRINTDGTIF